MGVFDNIPTKDVQKESFSILVETSRKIAIYEHLLRIKELQRTIFFEK